MDALSVRQHQNHVHQADSLVPTRTAVLHLRPAPTAEEAERAQRQHDMRVTWSPDVREPVNQHVSKCCCVFHKKKLFGESSSDSSSSSTDSSDEDADSKDAGTTGPGGDSAGCVGHQGGRGHDCQHAHHHPPRKQRPQCTKEHCYCGTRFH
ncbi:Protein phosphatase inhibitor [Leishmania donovani]|uniref:Protein_phosphatase_inhibitor_-_putative n=3 Tax=Leishmania donovani species complex TaxID=38574 RepID=A0A6L0WT35_LEIIN|nr:conserved hypothetical protein [Leishmania infantum JPCM5]XP_003858521.1 hypothetical protein, conserved [Leishmania donovani]CAC9449066.1 Protein_phosphatase_inhibitor_-_putative [Leishmania infantum]CAJ1986316.1 Protein phosphatase inhibitor [Leishmania donovani]CAM65647.1 conserved hypothetical protein [Leishmania infantum JPCM5]CBZ31798.1 hypothetical protein, conserved [Leishmania donovani]SUZ39265.1 Protein_phosphatase_inhibitor_-_putative [Leishmania infantum]|eukprot:XP_001463291.1 conserved hypothetical protein [Leishmania infantum JPCM5]